MKTRLFALLCFSGFVSAQVYTPPPENAEPGNEPPREPARTQEPGNAQGPLGREIPLLDLSAETITVGGITIPLGDNRLLRARFEKYLSQPPESGEEARRYREDVRQILATISPLRPGGPNLSEAFKLLPGAASYPGDANLCGSLAEAVYTAMLAKRDVEGLKKLNESIESEKQQIIREGDWHARHDKETEFNKTRDAKGQTEQTTRTAPGHGTASLAHAEKLRRIAEIEALKKVNIARTEAQTLQTKAQFQVNMVQWFMQRRYEHVLMAARFYNQIWQDGDTRLRINRNSEVARLFSQSVGVSPTVSSLDSLSNEAIREVEKYVEACRLLLDRGELHSASQRLLEAYLLGEYLAPVATLEADLKRRVLEYQRGVNELHGAMQAHDYTKAKELAADLKKQAKDFPSSKVDSAIAAYTLASDLAIEEAKALALAKNTEKAAEKIKIATEIWPMNPKLDEFRQLVNRSGTLVSAQNDFDRLLTEGNFREIARRQYEIAPAIAGDTKREEAFRQVMTNLTTIETALGKAAEFSKVDQNYAAWEQLAKLREQFPDDPKLGRELESLAPKVADFTRALDQARQFEGRTPPQTGTALSWYLKAQSIYPDSELAASGIKRQLDAILPEER
ncbi:MAG: hypothetical protein QM627_14035 [Luteolibacter sp.]